MTTTLSGGEAVAILLKAVVCALATGGQDARTGSGFWGRQLFGSRLHTLAPGTILAGGGGVEVEWQPRCQVRPSRSCPKSSLPYRQREDTILV